MNRLVKNYIYNVLYQIFLIIVPLITAPYLTRMLSSNALGIYDYINSITSIITTFGLIGLQSYGYRQIAYHRDNKLDASKEFTSIFLLRLLLLIVISVFYIPIAGRSDYRVYFYIQYALIVAQFLDVSWIFIGFEDLKVVSMRNFAAKFLTVIGIFLCVKSDNQLWVYFALFAFTTLVTTISVYPLMKKYIQFVRVDIKQIVSHIWGSAKLFIPQVATLLYLQFDKIMLKELTGSTAQVAYYSYAEKIINIPLAVVTALGTVMMPRLANLYSNDNKNAIQSYLLITVQFAMFLAIPMMVGLATIADGFIPWYLGEEYIISAKAIMVLSPICVFNALSNIFGAQYLTAVNKTKELTIAYYSTAAINIILNAVLIPTFAYLGAAIATLVSSFTSILVQYYYVRQEIKFIGIRKNIIKVILSAGAMMFTLFVLKMLLPISAISTFIEILVGGIIYLIMTVLLGESTVNKFKYMIMRRIGRKK